MKTIRELTNEIGIWAVNNFDYLDTIGEGMLEELGELAHAQFKFKQKVRRSSPDMRKDLKQALEIDVKDALADCIIFLLNWCFIKNIVISEEEARHYAFENRKGNELVAMGLILGSLGQIFIMHATNFSDDPILRRPYAQRIFNNLALCCKLNGWDFMKVLMHTWTKVSKRNWRKYPKDGLTR